MPITLDKKLPAVDILRSENIFVMDDIRATHQDIRPMNVLILNLMPTKVATETQLLRLLANTPLQINVDFLYMTSHESKTTAAEHMEVFYKSFEDIKENYYDGLIITGAPVEKLAFEEVDYWEELTKVFAWSKRHVFSTLHLCWGAQAGLYYRYGIEKIALCDKLSGIYEQTVMNPQNRLMRGFDDARDFIHKHIIVKLDGILESGSWRDPKSYLQEISQRVDNQTPVYKVLSEEGPDHDKVFTLGVFVGDNMMGRGIGPAKQVAQQQAARAAIDKYKESGEK